MMRYDSRWWTSIVLAGGLALVQGCGGKRVPASQPAPAPPPAPPPVQVAAPPAPASRPAVRPAPATAPAPTEEELFERLSLAELNAKMPLGDAFFAYDKADLTEEARATLQRDAGWLRKWSHTSVLITGHADERGTAEYNLALGELRAASARDFLKGLGIDASRIQIVSKGKEQPFCTVHEEDCWFENRRAHFIVTAK